MFIHGHPRKEVGSSLTCRRDSWVTDKKGVSRAFANKKGTTSSGEDKVPQGGNRTLEQILTGEPHTCGSGKARATNSNWMDLGRKIGCAKGIMYSGRFLSCTKISTPRIKESTKLSCIPLVSALPCLDLQRVTMPYSGRITSHYFMSILEMETSESVESHVGRIADAWGSSCCNSS